MNTFLRRMVGAAKLDVHVYEEVEADTGALGQAMGVVVLASLAAGIGSSQQAGWGGLAAGTVAALIGWYLWAILVYIIGTKMLPEPQTQSSMGELLRTIGFASSPGLLRIFGLIPHFTGIVFFLVSVWMLVAMVVGVRQALDYRSTGRAIGVCVIGWVIQVLFVMGIFAIFGGFNQNLEVGG